MIQAFRKWKKKYRMNRFYKEMIHSGTLCFDIGANHGTYSQLFLNAGAEVVAVEPQHKCIDSLKKRFNHSEKIILIHAAVGDHSGEAELSIGENDEISTLSNDFINAYGRFEYNKWIGKEKIILKTLDDLILKFGVPDFCKIDVEGWETEVLKGLTQTLPLVSIEYNYLLKEKTLQCVSLLEQLGMKQFNFSPYEQCDFVQTDWFNAAGFRKFLEELSDDIKHGDVFVRI